MQRWWIAKHERDRSKCPKCGSPAGECNDPQKPWYPQRTICERTAEERRAERLYDRLHEKEPFHDGTWSRWSEKPSAEFRFHYMDGVTIWAAPMDLNPDDMFTTDRNADPRGGDDDGGAS